MDKLLPARNSMRPGPCTLRRPLLLFVLILSVLFLCEWGYAAYSTFVTHRVYPETTPLFQPDARFSDWTNFLPRAAHLGEKDMQTRQDLGLPYPYPLPSIYIYFIYEKLFTHPTRAFLFSACAIFAAGTLSFLFYLRSAGGTTLMQVAVVLAVLLGSPVAFLLDRANIEVFLWLFIVLGLVCFVRRRRYPAAILFALAASMKIYPALFFLLFLPRRQWSAFFVACGTTLTLTLTTLARVGPSISQALRDMRASTLLLRNAQVNVLALPALRFDHSLFALLKQILRKIHVFRVPSALMQEMSFDHWLKAYSILIPLAFLLLYFLRLRRLPLLNQFIALTAISVLAPYVSYEYTLIHLYSVFAVLLLYSVQDDGFRQHPQVAALLLGALAVIFSPLSVLARTYYPGQVKCLALLLILTIALKHRMPSKLFGDPACGTAVRAAFASRSQRAHTKVQPSSPM